MSERGLLEALGDAARHDKAVAFAALRALRGNDLAEARQWAGRWSRLQADRVEPWLVLAIAELHDGYPDAARAMLQRASEASSGKPQIALYARAARAALQAGLAGQAAALMARILATANGPLPTSLAALASRVTIAAGLPGWVARHGPGMALVAVRGDREVRLDLRAFDAPALQPQELPLGIEGWRFWQVPVAVDDLDARLFAGDGIPALGSPLPVGPAWSKERAAATATTLPGRAGSGGERAAIAGPRGVAIVVPVYGGDRIARDCIDSVLRTLPDGVELIVIDDAGPEPELRQWLRRHAGAGRLRLIEHETNLGFPAAANRGIEAAGGRDVILLNSDALVNGDWIQRLCDAAASDPAIGTVTALSNDASICSYPLRDGPNEMPDADMVREIDGAAARANEGIVADLPTGVGFCMWIRRELLDQAGLFDVRAFGRGYGEENDLCRRAAAFGWRNVAAANVYVGHVGGHSFGGEKSFRMRRNGRTLSVLHPDYDRLVADWLASDPLVDARARIDATLLLARSRDPAVLLVTLDLEGGVRRHVDARVAELRQQGIRPLLLVPCPQARAGACTLQEGDRVLYPNLVFVLPKDLATVARLLSHMQLQSVEIHHLLNHHRSVATLPQLLELPYEVVVHDYAGICPRVVLVDERKRWCGEPPVDECERCLALNGSLVGPIESVAALRDATAKLLAGARRVVVPTDDVRARLARYVPGLAAEIVPWEPPGRGPLQAASVPAGRAVKVALLGAIGDHKGYALLLAAAQDAVRRDLPIWFVVVGYTQDDAALLRTGRVFVTGRHDEDEADALLAAQDADIALFANVCPETWSYTLTRALAARLPVLAFDFGAIGERLAGVPHCRTIAPTTDAGRLNQQILDFARSGLA